MTCQRCTRDAVVTVDCRDSRGPWRLCSPCWREITADNAALRRPRTSGGDVAAIAAPSAVASQASLPHSETPGPSPAATTAPRPPIAKPGLRDPRRAGSGDVAPRAAVPVTLELERPV